VLLRFAMLSLICALTAGVFGFEGAAPSLPSMVVWARSLFLPFLAIAVASLTGGALVRNGIGWEQMSADRRIAALPDVRDAHASVPRITP
jgi:uncharacterized membrane protein YtjA (UPF0391 family)